MRYVATLAVVMLMGGAMIAAQGGSPTATPDPKVKADNGKVITLNGCVMIGGATNFLLTNLKADSAHPTATKGDTAAASYALVERDGVDVGSHVNQRVELTGVLVRAATPGDHDDKFSVKGTTGKEKVKVARGPANEFVVASVKTVAPTCTP